MRRLKRVGAINTNGFGTANTSMLMAQQEELDYTIHLKGEICSETVDPIIKNLIEIEEENFREITVMVCGEHMIVEPSPDPVKIYIDSEGGQLDSGMALISQIKSMKTEVHTILLGRAFSMALPIWMSGDKRFVSPLAQLMFHNPKGGAYGTPLQVQKYSEEFNATDARFFDLCVPEGLDENVLAKFIDAAERSYDFDFTGKEAYDWGFASDLLAFKPRAKVLVPPVMPKEDMPVCNLTPDASIETKDNFKGMSLEVDLVRSKDKEYNKAHLKIILHSELGERVVVKKKTYNCIHFINIIENIKDIDAEYDLDRIVIDPRGIGIALIDYLEQWAECPEIVEMNL